MAKSRKLKVNLSYTKEEFGKIKAGSIARSMEDKWDIVYEDDWLHFYRSWTGVEIYRAKFTPLSHGNYELQEILVNDDEIETTDSDHDFSTIQKLIQYYLLIWGRYKNIAGGALTFHWTGAIHERILFLKPLDKVKRQGRRSHQFN